MKPVARWQIAPSTFAFSMCIVVAFLEMIGPQSCTPVLTPYGTSMSLSKFEIGTLFTSSALGAVASSFLLPALSDRKGRKLAVILSTSGTAAGYLLQGVAHMWALPLSYAVLLLGRIVAGLFGGVGAVLAAYVTEISASDYGLLRHRMTAMAGVQQLSGLVLVPLAGFLATFGLYIPFLAVVAAALLGTLILMAFFRNPAEVEAQEAAADFMVASDTAASGEASPKPSRKPAPSGVQRPFWQDTVLNAYMLCFVCCGFVGVAITPLLAFLIQYPSYGLLRDDAYLTQELVAQVASLLMLPQKLTEMTTMLVVSPVLSRRLGDRACSVVGATTMSLGTLGLALLAWFGDDGTRQGTAEHIAVAPAGAMPVSFTDAPAPPGRGGFEGRVWMVAASLVCHGFGDGLLLPILLGSARYRGEVYPDRLAGAGGYVTRGVFVGLVVGVPISLQVAEAFSLGMAWFLLLAVGCLSYVFLVLADRLGQAKASARQVSGRAGPRHYDSESTSAGTSEADIEVQMMPM